MKDLFMMTGMAKLLLSIFGLLIVQHGSVDAVYTMNETCLYYAEGYIANPDNCQAWGYCSGGSLTHQGTCPDGYLYDSSKAICNYASQVTCSTSAEDICANLDEPGYVADPNDCNRYCYCSNKQIVSCSSCPTNQLYEPSLVECNYDYTCPTDSVCRLVKNNVFVGASTCGEFIRCVDGTGTAQKCSNSTYYNNLTGMCQKSNPCTTSNNSSSVTYAPDTSACSAYNTTKGGVQYVEDGYTCYGYYSCSSASGSGQWRSCDYATHFDPTLQECVSPISYACKLNRCGNINIQFATVPFTNCTEYHICSGNQASTANYTCTNANYPYIDEVNGGCVDTKPSYAICNITST